MDLIEPIDLEINGHNYRLGKFPATVGREIIVKYPLGNLPKISEYELSEEVMLKVMSYVEAVKQDGQPIRLVTKELVNNHVPDWETLVKLEYASLEHNCSFFQNGKAANFLQDLMHLAQQKVIEILTRSSEQLSQAEKQRSGN